MSSWSHLPSAGHIDRILDAIISDKKRFDEVVQLVSWQIGWDVWDDARESAIREIPHGSMREDATNRFRRAGSKSAVLALIAWPHSVTLLDMPPDVVRVLAALGDTSAILLLPAVVALQSETTEI